MTNKKNSQEPNGRKFSDETEKFNNPKYTTDVEWAMQINRWMLKALGLWGMIQDTRNFRIYCLARIHVMMCILLFSFILIPGFLYIFVKEKDSAIRLKMTGVLSFCVMTFVKYVTMFTNRRTIGRCLEDIVDNWKELSNNEDFKIMYDYALLGRYGSILCTCIVYSGGIFYGIVMPILMGNIVIPDTNITIRPIPYPGYFVYFDPQTSPNYEIVFATHCLSSFVMHSAAIAACSLAISFVMHACSQLEMIVAWLDRLVDGDKENSQDVHPNARLAVIVAHHVKTLSFISRTANILRTICLVELLGSTLNLCLLGFDILTEWGHSGPVATVTYTILIGSFIFNIFVFCYIGEILSDGCKKVGEKAYMIEWYKLPGKTAVGLTLTIATAGNPVTITAGKFTNLSMTTFCTVLRTSIGYLNILRALTA